MYPITQLHFCEGESAIPLLWCSGHLAGMSRVGGEEKLFLERLKRKL